MPLKIERIRYSNAGNLSESTTLKANIQDRCKMLIRFSVEKIIFASDDSRFIFSPHPYMISSGDNVNIIHCPDSEGFLEFAEGEVICAQNVQTNPVGGEYYIIETKFDNQTIKVLPIVPTTNTTYQEIGEPATESERATIYVNNIAQNLSVYFNLYEKGSEGGYLSNIDGEEQRFFTEILYQSMFYINLQNIGGKSHHVSKAKFIFHERINSSKFVFDLEIDFRVFGYYKEDDILNILNGTQLRNPSYDLSLKIENYAASTEVLKSEIKDTTIEIGGFNTTFQSPERYYNVSDLTYTVDSQLKGSIALNQQTTVKFRYNSTSSIIHSLLEVTFLVANESFLEVKDKETVYENAIGFNYAGTANRTQTDVGHDAEYTAITSNLTCVSISPNTVEVTFTVNLGAKILSLLEKAENKYLLCITEYKEQRERTIIDLGVAKKYLPTLSIFSADTLFSYDPSSKYYAEKKLTDPSITDPSDQRFNDTLPEVYMTDHLEAYTRLAVPVAEGARIDEIGAYFIAKNNITGDEVIFDKYIFDARPYPYDFELKRIFNYTDTLPVRQTYKNIFFAENTETISGLQKYNICYNFVVGNRADKYLQQQNIPDDLYANMVTKLSDEVLFYENTQDWDIYHKISITFNKNGDDYSQGIYKKIIVRDYTESTWTLIGIKIYDIDSNTELTSGSETYIKGKVRAVGAFTKNILPDLNLLSANFYLQKEKEDGIRESFAYQNGLSLCEAVEITTDGTNIFVTGIIDANIINKNCRLYCRLFEAYDIVENIWLLEDIGDWLTEDGENILLEQ